MSSETLRTLIWSILALDAIVMLAAIVYWRWPRARPETRPRRRILALLGMILCLSGSVATIRAISRRERALQHYYAGIDQVKRGDLAAAERELRESLRWDPRSTPARQELDRVREQPRAARREQSVRLQPAPPSVRPASASGAAPEPATSKPPPKRAHPPKPPHLPSPFAITRYDLTANLEPHRGALTATARITVRSRGERLRRLSFSLSPEFVVESARQGTERLRFDQRNDLLEITLVDPVDASGTQSLEVRYRRRPVASQGDGRGRTAAHRLRSGDQIAAEGTFLRSESRWYPATGELDFRAPVTVAVTVPRGYTAVSVGALIGIEKQGDRATFRWATDRPAAMIALTAAPYVQKTLPVEGVKATVFSFARDAARADAFLRETARIVRFLSERFGPYPFEKIAIAEIPRFPGGYGSTSFVMLTEASFRAKATPTAFLAHEIAHQWWGNSVFPQGPGAGWLSEAFAEYASYLYLERVGGAKALRQAVRQATSDYLDAIRRRSEEPIRETDPYDQRGAYEAVVYHKGALVLHALRYTVGEQRFFSILRRFADAHRHGTATIDEFRAIAESVHGAPLGWFFDQWLGRTGAPRLRYHYTERDGTVDVQVSQPSPPYRLALDLAVDTRNRIARHRVQLEGERQLLTLPVSGPVSALGFDPDDWILKQEVRWESGALAGSP
jgi:aminopeptidase N